MKNLHLFHLIQQIQEFHLKILLDLILVVKDFGIHIVHILKLKLMYHKWMVLNQQQLIYQ